MKTRIKITILTLAAAINITAQTTYHWVGGNSGNFTAALNWNPVRQISLSNDILVFDNGGSIELLNVYQQTIGQLLISNNTHITMTPSIGNTRVLSISGVNGVDFLIENGSSLQILGNDPKLGIFLKNDATAEVYGDITLRGEIAHYINAQDANSFLFKNNSTFTQMTPGYAFTNSGTANAIIFENGSFFITKHNNASTPFGLNAPNSKVIFKENSTFSAQISNANSINLNNRTYGNFEVTMNSVILFTTTNLESVTFNRILITNGSNLTINNTNSTQTSQFFVGGIITNNGTFALSNNIQLLSLLASNVTVMGNSPVYLSNNQNTASSNNISQAKEFSLSQNYPNPFNPSTKINYTLGKDSKVSLKIYDINGKEVANLIDANQSSGNHTVTFDGKNLSSGTYFYTLSTDNGYTKTLRMTIAK